MDLLSLTPSERMVEILHPGTKQPLGIRVTLKHVDDPSIKALKRRFYDEAAKKNQRGKFVNAEAIDNNSYELAFATMTGWEWYNPTGSKGDKGYDESKMPKLDEGQPDFNKRNAFALFEKLPWFLDQIGEEISDTEAFFQR